VMASATEIAAMRRAIAISAAGLGTTSPNPPVGCVIIGTDGVIVGEGYHERKGEAHAETQALAAAGPRARNATAVVTLEPCNHQGRTPACRQALIDAGIGRVVIALIDPTSRGEGGAAVLRAAGVDVETGVLAEEARHVLGPWLTALALRRPVVTWACFLDGSGIVALPDDIAAADMIRLTVDAVLYADGRVEEAVPGTHGVGILELKDASPGVDPAEIAKSLYASGVRHLLLQGALDVAAPFLAAGLVDRVISYLSAQTPSRPPIAELPWPLLPPGFEIADIRKTCGLVRVASAAPE
jgi:diaminohydroxyphosphoribosylaminopyrimidine deaminase/5-amino-6-(5-phosphoribosylamino)uracil reductase